MSRIEARNEPSSERRLAGARFDEERRSSVTTRITRQSETFRIPAAARRSTPPERGPRPAKEAGPPETVRCRVPESVKMLSYPTPQRAFEPIDVARTVETRRSLRYTPPAPSSPARELGNAVALFVFLVATSVVAARLIAAMIFV